MICIGSKYPVNTLFCFQNKVTAWGLNAAVHVAVGDSFFDMEALELREKYIHRQAAEVEELWEELYSSCLGECIHRGNCAARKMCTQGKRITEVRLISCHCCV